MKNLADSGITGKTYLTRSLINKIFNKELTADEIDDLVIKGKLVRRFSYYQASDELLRELGIVADSVAVNEQQFGKLAKHNAFTLKEIQEMFGDCNKDTARAITDKYFYKKYNYWYKNDYLISLLTDGEEEFAI